MNKNRARFFISNLLLAALLAVGPGVASSSPQIRVQPSADDMQQRILAAAEIAGASYDTPGTVTYAGRTFSPVLKLLRDCVRTYRYDDPTTLGLIIAFRGTVDFGDVVLDLRGAAKTTANPVNPLTNLAENGKIGSGFNSRPFNYLKKFGTDILYAIAVARNNHRRVEVVLIGHSMGGIDSEIAALYLSRAIQHEHPGDNNIVVTNMSFSSPRGADAAFRAAYEAEVVSGRLNSVSVIRSHDAVAKLNVVATFRGIGIAASGRTPGFKAEEHSIKLPYKTWLWSTENHSIDVIARDLRLLSNDPLHLHPIMITLASKSKTNLPLGDSSPVSGACGNGILNTGEQCDDDNTTSGDKCSGTCSLEQFQAGCHDCWSSGSTAAAP